jgi:hypothetical protein
MVFEIVIGVESLIMGVVLVRPAIDYGEKDKA